MRAPCIHYFYYVRACCSRTSFFFIRFTVKPFVHYSDTLIDWHSELWTILIASRLLYLTKSFRVKLDEHCITLASQIYGNFYKITLKFDHKISPFCCTWSWSLYDRDCCIFFSIYLWHVNSRNQEAYIQHWSFHLQFKCGRQYNCQLCWYFVSFSRFVSNYHA